MIKLDNTKALKALGMRPTDGFNVEDNASADSYENVTMGEYAPAPEVDSKNMLRRGELQKRSRFRL